MTWNEAYTSLKQLYKKMMFPNTRYANKWTMAEIDQLDVHFFYSLLDGEEIQPQQEVFLSDIW